MRPRHACAAAGLLIMLSGSLAGSATPTTATTTATPTPAEPATAVPDAATLLVAWTVDLRPTPEAPAYLEELVITSVADLRFEGTFSGSPITEGRINRDRGAVRLAFVTSDGSGPSLHSAVLHGGVLEGLTNSTGRDFLSDWSASRTTVEQGLTVRPTPPAAPPPARG